MLKSKSSHTSRSINQKYHKKKSNVSFANQSSYNSRFLSQDRAFDGDENDYQISPCDSSSSYSRHNLNYLNELQSEPEIMKKSLTAKF